MWFKKHQQNKRHRRHNVLDVKMRSDHVRAVRMRGLAVMVGVLFGTAFSLYLLWRSGEWVLDRLVYENRAFSIHAVDVSTDGWIAVEQLRRWSGAQAGQNLMALDLAQVKSNLELVPNIRSVSVERLLPRTLRIRVIERKPLARVFLPRLTDDDQLVVQAWLLDEEGAVMLPLEARHRQGAMEPAEKDLPVLTGVSHNELRLGRAVDSSRLRSALRLLKAFNHSAMAGRVRLERLDLGEPGVLVAVTSDGAHVTLGMNDFDTQLARWNDIHGESIRLRKTILTLNLAVENNVPVRWVDAQAIESDRST